jgi:hypothetical protein
MCGYFAAQVALRGKLRVLSGPLTDPGLAEGTSRHDETAQPDVDAVGKPIA